MKKHKLRPIGKLSLHKGFPRPDMGCVVTTAVSKNRLAVLVCLKAQPYRLLESGGQKTRALQVSIQSFDWFTRIDTSSALSTRSE